MQNRFDITKQVRVSLNLMSRKSITSHTGEGEGICNNLNWPEQYSSMFITNCHEWKSQKAFVTLTAKE